MSAKALTPPEPIGADHNLVEFDSGEPTLDEWPKKCTLKNSAGGADDDDGDGADDPDRAGSKC